MLRSVTFCLLLAHWAIAECPPRSIYDSYLNTCYQFVSTPKSFFDAEQYCNSLGGHLTDETNAFESSFIAGIASGASSKTPDFWIGASLLRSSNWTWTSDASMRYTNWAKGQPNNAHACVQVKDTEGTWITLPCNNVLPFMCKISPNAAQPGSCPTQVPSPNTPLYSCPTLSYCTGGYTLYPRNCMCYKYINSTYLSFTDATAFCSQEGGMLAKIESQDVNDFLTVLPGFITTSPDVPWIGLTCTGSNKTSCSWVDGTPLGSYSNFYFRTTAVNNPYTLVAVTSKSYLDDGKWQFVPHDDYKEAFICQKDSIVAQINNCTSDGCSDGSQSLATLKRSAFLKL